MCHGLCVMEKINTERGSVRDGAGNRESVEEVQEEEMGRDRKKREMQNSNNIKIQCLRIKCLCGCMRTRSIPLMLI